MIVNMMTINIIALYWTGHLPILQIGWGGLIFDFVAQREFRKSKGSIANSETEMNMNHEPPSEKC